MGAEKAHESKAERRENRQGGRDNQRNSRNEAHGSPCRPLKIIFTHLTAGEFHSFSIPSFKFLCFSPVSVTNRR